MTGDVEDLQAWRLEVLEGFGDQVMTSAAAGAVGPAAAAVPLELWPVDEPIPYVVAAGAVTR